MNTTLSPETQRRTRRTGIVVGLAAVAWAGGFAAFKSSFPPAVFWTLLVSVTLLIIGVPALLAGRRARRLFLRNHS